MQFITSLSYWRLSEKFFQRYDHEIRFFPLAGSNLIYSLRQQAKHRQHANQRHENTSESTYLR